MNMRLMGRVSVLACCFALVACGGGGAEPPPDPPSTDTSAASSIDTSTTGTSANDTPGRATSATGDSAPGDSAPGTSAPGTPATDTSPSATSPVATPPVAPASTAKISGQVYKGLTYGASVCVFAIDAGARGARMAAQPDSAPTPSDGCVVTAADGTYSFVLPAGTQGDLLVEATGGTYCSDETRYDGTRCTGGGTPISMGTNALRTVVTAQPEGTVQAHLTLLTTAAVQSSGALSATAFAASYAPIAANFAAPSDPATSPGAGPLATVLGNLAVYVGTDTTDLADIVSDIAAGTLIAKNTTFAPGVELAVGTDGGLLHLFKATRQEVVQVSTATLPGIPGSYSRSGSTITVKMPRHGIRNGLWISLRFAAGTGGSATSGTYKVTEVDADTFTVADTASGTITGGRLLRDPATRLLATYVQHSGNDFITVTAAQHGLRRGDSVELKATTGGAADVGTLVAAVLDADTFTLERNTTATADAAGDAQLGIGSNHMAYDAVMHPSGKWLYVSSGYECWNGPPFCWGGETIATYRIDWHRGKLTLLNVIRTGEVLAPAAPTRMAVNAAGTQLAHLDHAIGYVVLWNVDPATGTLSRVANSQPYRAYGNSLVFSPDGRTLHHGIDVLDVKSLGDPRSPFEGAVGGADIVGNVLFFTDSTDAIHAVSIATPSGMPATLASNRTRPGRRGVSTRDGRVLVTSGSGGIKTYRFDGATLAAAIPSIGSGELQYDGSSTLGGEETIYRSAHLNAGGDLAVASYYTATNGTGRPGGPPSGFLFATVGADGRLVRISNASSAQHARAARFIKQPWPAR
ncbi:beta-propeller fold lactonase family protein [Ramlibacter sp. AN1015]|uniref:beta-propeller fold lactonase family protein n=1 Tax=Ramlibacter sp. AN1015 TaxID=3133428 RepID=UPI0030C4A81A